MEPSPESELQEALGDVKQHLSNGKAGQKMKFDQGVRQNFGLMVEGYII